MHRDSQKRIYLDEAIYFVTFNTKDGYPFFEEDLFCEIFMDNLKICKMSKRFELCAFNVLYNHVHLLLKPGKYNISKIIKSLKENVSCDINRVMNVNEGATPASRLREIYRKKRMDLERYRKLFIKKYGRNTQLIPQFRWKKSFHDHIIRNERDFANHFQYAAYNHLKHGLDEDWRYISANNPNFANLA